MIKFRKMRRIIFCMIAALTLSMAFTACGNKKDSTEKTDETVESDANSQQESADLSNIKIDYKTSELYSKEDMDAAIKLILEEFNTWEGCTLYDISYTDDQNCTDNLSHVNELSDDKQFDECIVFTSNFHSPKEGGGAWEPDYEHTRAEWNDQIMGKIIAVANQKGGVGKTTTAINLSAALAQEGKKILVVDIDPQGNCTSGFGIDKNKQENTIYELLLDDCTINECIIRGIMDGIDLIAANVNLAASEIELIGIPRKEFILRDALDYIKDDYDYIIMDCPPSLNILTVNAMVAADSVIVPIQCEYYALEGLSQLIHTINLVKARLNRKLDIEGIVFTMFDARTNLSAQVVENVKEHVEQHIYETVIPRNIRLAEAPSYGEPITVYDKKSSGAEAYRALAREVIKKDSNV